MNIFVAKLNYRTTKEELQSAFEQFGEVSSAKIIMDRDTGRSKGYGFVEMSDDDSANAAITALNESDLDGQNIVVKQSEDRPKRDNHGAGNRY
ncbi:MAG: RNA-binding protein [Saprospiraceae bacterium]|nr:RNA-binding protein [Saprospiraceae bacterium]